MLAWQVATILMLIALSQMAVAIFYMRSRAITHPEPNTDQRWRIIFLLNLILFIISLILLRLPNQSWWN